MPAFKRNARINRMPDFETFVRSWDWPTFEDSEHVDLMTTQFGNINSTGNAGDYSGPALHWRHPQFFDSLEPGVRELVRLLAEDGGLITYTSCEGHRYPGTGLPPTERHVGVAPRHAGEHRAIMALFEDVARAVNARFPLGPIRVEVIAQNLESDAAVHAVVDVFLRRRAFRTWTTYFTALDVAYGVLLDLLRDRIRLPFH